MIFTEAERQLELVLFLCTCSCTCAVRDATSGLLVEYHGGPFCSDIFTRNFVSNSMTNFRDLRCSSDDTGPKPPPTNARMKLLVLMLITLGVGAFSINPIRIPNVINDHGTCTISANGRDDSQNLLATVHDRSCNKLIIPTHTTLNIGRKLDMTGLENKHIVRIHRFSSTSKTETSLLLLVESSRDDKI